MEFSKLAALGAGVACAMWCFSAEALAPLVDLNTIQIQVGTPAGAWLNVGGRTLFFMDDRIHGAELWGTDGTADGTALVADINPGPMGSNPQSLTVLNGVLYFFANDGTDGQALWRSDGTTAGTYAVSVAGPGGQGSDGVPPYSTPMIMVDGVMYFNGISTQGGELWRSDGTTPGTYQVADIYPGPNGSDLGMITAVGSHLFFQANDGVTGQQLWYSDGTPGGTHIVQGIYPTSTNAAIIANAPGGLYLQAGGAKSNELWFVDDNGQNAHLVTSLAPPSTNGGRIFGAALVGGALVMLDEVTNSRPQDGGLASGAYLFKLVNDQLSLIEPFKGNVTGTISPFLVMGNHAVFSDSAGLLWSTDGTAAGTAQIGASRGMFVNGNFPYAVHGAPEETGVVYFYGATQGHPQQLDVWQTDGTEAGTQVHWAMPGQVNPGDIAEYNGQLYFTAGSITAAGIEPWIANGDGSQARMLADLMHGSASSNPSGFTVSGNHVYFTANTSSFGQGPVVSDGTASGTIPLGTFNTPIHTEGSNPVSLTALGNKLLFTANDGIHGAEPWVTDGTATGTRLLAGIAPGTTALAPNIYVPLGANMLFGANDGIHGYELWVSDGTPVNTRMLADINSGSGSSNALLDVAGSAVLNGVLYFGADDGVHGETLWRTDGTVTGTYEVSDLQSDPSGGVITYFKALNGRLLFVRGNGDGNFWWSSDGTKAGTSRITMAANVSGPGVSLGGFVYFPATDQLNGSITTGRRDQIWRTDGTAAGTTQVTKLFPGAAQSGVDNLFATSTRILFNFCASDCAFYGSDGTAAGTQQIDSNLPNGLGLIFNDRLFYTTNNGTYSAIRASDGTVAGTSDYVRFPDGYDPLIGRFAIVHGQLLVTATDPVIGPGIWRIDGKTNVLNLVAMDPDAVDPAGGASAFVPIGNDLYFASTDPLLGSELFLMRGTFPVSGDDSAQTNSGTPVTVPVLRNDGSWSGLNPGTVSVTATPAHGSARVNADGTVLYSPATGFAGTDQFSYTVADVQGQRAAPAKVSVRVTRPVAPAAGVAPSSSSSSGGSSSGGGSSSSSGVSGSGSSNGGGGSSGGGAFDPAALFALMFFALYRSQLLRKSS